MEPVSISISILSLAISATTLWVTYLRRGRLAMTKPTIVFFGFDTTPKPTAKVFVRTLLYSTATNGQVVESMYAVLRHAGDDRVFSFWGYGETDRLSPGSGVYVSRTGLAANHHFVMSVHEPDYRFSPGRYDIAIYARVVGKRKQTKLAEIGLTLTEDLAASLARFDGVLFERSLPADGYRGHARGRE